MSNILQISAALRLLADVGSEKKDIKRLRDQAKVLRRDHYEPERFHVVTPPEEQIATLLDYKVMAVDGDWLRNIDIDFVAGGNPARYSYVPLDELWVEKVYEGHDREATILHELVECEAMMNHKLSYDDAHDVASLFEIAYRKHSTHALDDAFVKAVLKKSESLAAKMKHAYLKEGAQDLRSIQLAITHILLSNGWMMNNFGKVVKPYKVQFQQSKKFYILETSANGAMYVRDQAGKVFSRVDLSKVENNNQIMQAAKVLNDGAANVKAASIEHYKNTCPSCGTVQQCRCKGDKVETTDICYDCKQKS